MKTISAELKQHLSSEVQTVAICWKLTLADSTVIGFTDHEKDIVFQSVTYQAASGWSKSKIEDSDNLAPDSMQVEGLIDSSVIKESDINAGKYDNAEVEVFLLNYKDLSQGKLDLRKGKLGEVTSNEGKFFAEIKGLADNLDKTIGDLYSPLCRANLGDSKCGVNLSSFTVTGTITEVETQQVVKDSSRAEASGYFDFGKITFTSGNNNGLSMEVRRSNGGRIELVLPMPYQIQVGDSYSLVAGCDKTFNTCKERFSNVVNFRGEPHVPGTDFLLQTATTLNKKDS